MYQPQQIPQPYAQIELESQLKKKTSVLFYTNLFFNVLSVLVLVYCCLIIRQFPYIIPFFAFGLYSTVFNFILYFLSIDMKKQLYTDPYKILFQSIPIGIYGVFNACAVVIFVGLEIYAVVVIETSEPYHGDDGFGPGFAAILILIGLILTLVGALQCLTLWLYSVMVQRVIKFYELEKMKGFWQQQQMQDANNQRMALIPMQQQQMPFEQMIQN